MIGTRNHNPRVGGSNPSAATHDRTRQTPPNPVPIHDLRHAGPESTGSPNRPVPSRAATNRPLTATASATVGHAYASPGGEVRASTEPTIDYDLALVIDRWGQLPEPVRAGILAMVRASHLAPSPASLSAQNRRNTRKGPILSP